MTKIKSSELTRAALDWAVAKAEGRTDVRVDDDGELVGSHEFDYSTDWSQGGPIIERHVFRLEDTDGGSGDIERWLAEGSGGVIQYGPTPLIAAMRCYVASKLGDEVEIPQELLS